MLLKNKQTIQTCRIRKYIILHNVVSYVTTGRLISIDCLLFDSKKKKRFIVYEKEKCHNLLELFCSFYLLILYNVYVITITVQFMNILFYLIIFVNYTG